MAHPVSQSMEVTPRVPARTTNKTSLNPLFVHDYRTIIVRLYYHYYYAVMAPGFLLKKFKERAKDNRPLFLKIGHCFYCFFLLFFENFRGQTPFRGESFGEAAPLPPEAESQELPLQHPCNITYLSKSYISHINIQTKVLLVNYH